jgi:hypothetical protein
MFSHKVLLLLAALSGTGPVLAQRAAVVPLAPAVVPVAAPQPVILGVMQRPSARPAAPVADQPSRTVRPQPVYLINSRIIVGSGLRKINPQDIADLQVYKDSSARVPASWRSLAANGIIAITLKPHRKPKLKAQSLAAIGRGLKLRGPVSYQLEGQPLKDPRLRVATADIVRLDAQPTASGTVVNIRLAVPPPAVHPPGTIMIRGTTGL